MPAPMADYVMAHGPKYVREETWNLLSVSVNTKKYNNMIEGQSHTQNQIWDS